MLPGILLTFPPHASQICFEKGRRGGRDYPVATSSSIFFFSRSGEKERVNNLALAGKNTEQPQGGVLF